MLTVRTGWNAQHCDGSEHNGRNGYCTHTHRHHWQYVTAALCGGVCCGQALCYACKYCTVLCVLRKRYTLTLFCKVQLACVDCRLQGWVQIKRGSAINEEPWSHHTHTRSHTYFHTLTQNGSQPIVSGSPGCCVNIGMFQLPLFAGKIFCEKTKNPSFGLFVFCILYFVLII